MSDGNERFLEPDEHNALHAALKKEKIEVEKKL